MEKATVFGSVELTEVEIDMIEIEKLVSAANNFFKPLSEKKLQELKDSVAANGLLVPIIVRVLENSNKYEILSGHNRVKAFEELGKDKIPARVVDVSDEQAREILIDSNVAQRNELSPLEIAQAYKEKMELLGKRQGQRTDLTNQKSGATRDIIGEIYEVSGMTVERYVRLLKLNDQWKNLLENKKVTPKVCFEISKLNTQAQEIVLHTLEQVSNDLTLINGEKAKEIGKVFKKYGYLQNKIVKNILLGKEQEPKINEVTETVHFKVDKVNKKWRSAEKILCDLLAAEKDVLQVKDVSKSNLGYDIEVYKSGCVKYIEVKSVNNLGDDVKLTNQEYAIATQHQDDYILAIARLGEENVDVCFIENPIANLSFTKKIVKIEWLCDDYEGELKQFKVN